MICNFKLCLTTLILSAKYARSQELELTTMYSNSGAAEYWSCNALIKETFTWDYEPLGLGEFSLYYDANCGYLPAVGSQLLCCASVVKNDTALMNKIFKFASDRCSDYSSYKHDWEWYRDQYENATNHFLPLNEILNTSLPIYSPSLPDKITLDSLYLGYQKFYFNIDSGTWFSVGICGYFLLLIMIASIYNLIRVSGLVKKANQSKFAKLCQKYVIFPTLFPNGKFAEPYGWKWFSALFPNRIEFIVDFFLFILQVVFYCVPYYENDGTLYSTPDTALQEALSFRSGTMAFGKIPLLILFAGRNNFLIYITGWSFTTFLHFHKVLAVWMTFDALVHSVCWTILELGYYTESLKETYFACGVAATVLAFIMCGFAIHSIREHYYQLFLYFHVILGIGFIVMCWYHCNTIGWMEWLIASCCVWFFDRLVRVIRMSFFGYRTATITVMDDDLIRVEVNKPSSWTHEAGQFGYIYFADWIFWENHPFTFVTKDNKVLVYIRMKKGLTKRIWEKVYANGGTMNWKICIEGPYSNPGSGGIHKMDDILLIAGGSGVPAILQAAGSTSKGKLVWVSQKMSNVRAYGELLKDVNIDTEIYITKETGVDSEIAVEDILNGSNSSNSSDNKSQDLEKSQSVGNIHIFYGRPDLQKVCDEYITSSNESNVGINACGPPKMMDDLRNIVANNATTWDKSVNFFDELQVW